MKYRNEYLSTRDIDWFCKINNKFIHVASAGGLLPSSINDRIINEKLQILVSELPDIYTNDQLSYNEEFLNKRFNNNTEAIEDYVRTFKEMAKKGFYSYDRTNFSEKFEDSYHLVVYPKQSKDLNNEELIETIPSFDIPDFVFDYSKRVFFCKSLDNL